MFHWPEQVTWPCLCSPGLGRIILLQGGSVKGGTLNMGEQYYCLPHLVCSLCGHPDSTWAPRGTFLWEQIWLFPFPYEGFQGDPIPDQTKFNLQPGHQSHGLCPLCQLLSFYPLLIHLSINIHQVLTTMLNAGYESVSKTPLWVP